MRRKNRILLSQENHDILQEEYTLTFEGQPEPEYKIRIKLMLNRYNEIWFEYEINTTGSPFARTRIYPGGIPPNFTFQIPLKKMFSLERASYKTTGVNNRTSVNSRHSIELLNANNLLYFRVHYLNREHMTSVSQWVYFLPGHEFRIWSTQDTDNQEYTPEVFDGVLPEDTIN